MRIYRALESEKIPSYKQRAYIRLLRRREGMLKEKGNWTSENKEHTSKIDDCRMQRLFLVESSLDKQAGTLI